MLALALLGGAAVWLAVGRAQEASLNDRLREAENFIDSGGERRHDPRWHTRFRALLAELSLGGSLSELTPSGQTLLVKGDFPAPVEPKGEPLADFRAAVYRSEFADGERRGTLVAKLVYKPADRTARWLWTMVGALAFTVAGLGVLFLLTGRWLIRPLRSLSKAVDCFAGADLIPVLPSSPMREVANVATAVEGMSATLQQRREREESIEQDRLFLISAVAHDLRTPLFALRGYLEAHRLGLPRSDGHIARVEEKARHLERLIGDLFLFTRLERAEIRPQFDLLDLGGLCRSAADAVEPLASSKGIAVTTSGVEDVVVRGDGHLLDRVAGNLLENAVRHSSSGGTIAIQWKREGADARVTVADEGPGIPDDLLPHLFEPLQRADDSRRSTTGGAGLGLAIARRLVHAHRGSSGGVEPAGRRSGLQHHLAGARPGGLNGPVAPAARRGEEWLRASSRERARPCHSKVDLAASQLVLRHTEGRGRRSSLARARPAAPFEHFTRKRTRATAFGSSMTPTPC